MLSLHGCDICLWRSKWGGVEIERLKARNDSLESVNAQLGEFILFVSESMDSVLVQESLILNNNIEGTHKGIKEQIKDNLDIYESLLNRQRERLAQMEDSLRNSSGENVARFKKIVEGLNQQIAEKDRMIASLRLELDNKKADISNLRTQVSALNRDVADLEEVTMAQEEALEASTNMLNTAYVKIGTRKELEASGLLSGGGFLKKKKLDLSAIDTDKFEAVDIRNFREIAIKGKKPKLLTQMPSNSYRIEKTGDGSKLIVVDPALFWSVSNVLIIQY